MKKSWLSGLVLSGSLGALVAIFILTQGCAGCGRYGKAYKAAKELAKNAKAYEKEVKEMESRPPVEPVNWRELVKLLPANIPGCEAQEPTGETMSWGEGDQAVKYSHAKKEYTAQDKNISIDIVDSGYRQIFFALGFAWFIQGEYDTSEGYLKSLKIKGQDAKINWKTKEKSGSLVVKVANRFFVTIEGNDLGGENDLIKVADLIDYGRLAGLK